MEAAERGQFDETERLARRALRLSEGLSDAADRHMGLARALRAIGTAQRARGRYGAAESLFRRALAAATAGFGPHSIEAAELHNDLGMTFKYLGRFVEAEAAYSSAAAILDGLPDVDLEDLAALYHNLGGLAHARGDFATAEPLARRAIEIRAQAVDARAPALLLDRSAHAAILSGLGRTEEAEASIRDLLGDLEPALGPDHPEVAVAINNLAAILQRKGALADAETLYRRVIAIREARLGVDSATLAGPLNNLGTVLRALGRASAATRAWTRAERLLVGIVEPDHPTLLAIRLNLGRPTHRTRESARAEAPEQVAPSSPPERLRRAEPRPRRAVP